MCPSLVLNTRPKQLSVLIPLDITLNVSDVYATLRLQVNEESNLCVQSGAEINKTWGHLWIESSMSDGKMYLIGTLAYHCLTRHFSLHLRCVGEDKWTNVISKRNTWLQYRSKLLLVLGKNSECKENTRAHFESG
jgi:hypothetical protein